MTTTVDEQPKPIVPRLSCTHETSEHRISYDALKRPRIALQCIICGRRVSNDISPKTFSREAIAAMPPWDRNLQRSVQVESKKAKFERQQFERQVQRDLKKALKNGEHIRQNAERQSAYNDYLKSEKWQNLRRKALARADSRCEGCGDKPATDVHHLTYERFGNEMLFDLVAVCKDCHKKIHQQSKATAEANSAIVENLLIHQTMSASSRTMHPLSVTA